MVSVTKQKAGVYAFLLGIVIAIIAGITGTLIAAYAGIITVVLVILGLIVGYLNISSKETVTFLVASIVLMVAGSASLTVLDTVIAGLGTALQAILANLVVFIAPAAVIVGLKAVYVVAKTT